MAYYRYYYLGKYMMSFNFIRPIAECFYLSPIPNIDEGTFDQKAIEKARKRNRIRNNLKRKKKGKK